MQYLRKVIVLLYLIWQGHCWAESGPAEVKGTNLFENPGVEEGTVDSVSDKTPPPGWNWNLQQAEGSEAKVGLDTNMFRSGLRSLKIDVKNKSSWIRLGNRKPFNIAEGRIYEASFCLKGDKKTQYRLQVDYGNIEGKPTYAQQDILVGTNWAKCSFVQAPPQGATNATVSLDVGSVGILWIDDAEFKEIKRTREEGVMTKALLGFDTALIFTRYSASIHVNRHNGAMSINISAGGKGIMRSEANLKSFDYVNIEDNPGMKILTAMKQKGELKVTAIFTPEKITFTEEWRTKLADVTEAGCGISFFPEALKGGQLLFGLTDGTIQRVEISDPLPEARIPIAASKAVKHIVLYTSNGRVIMNFAWENLTIKEFGGGYAPAQGNNPAGIGLWSPKITPGNKPAEKAGWKYEMEFMD